MSLKRLTGELFSYKEINPEKRLTLKGQGREMLFWPYQSFMFEKNLSRGFLHLA
jgi:hypothetical protein